MPSIMELADKRNQAIKTLEELRDIEDWTEDLEERWNQANQEYDTVSEEWRTAVASEDRRKQRDERLKEIQRELRSKGETRRYSDESHPEVMRNRTARRLENRSLCAAAWMLHGTGKRIRREMRTAIQEEGFDLNAPNFEMRFRPHLQMGGYGGWSSASGASLIRHAIDLRLARIEEEEKRSVEPGFHRTFAEDLETRDLGTGPAPDAGATIPQGFQYELDIALLQFGGLRRVARVWSTSMFNPIPWPTMNDTNNQADIIAEATDYGASVDPSFGEVVFQTYKFTSFPVIMSAEVLEDSAFNLGAIMGQTLGERIGRGTAQYFANGTGTDQPTGLLTAAPSAFTAPTIGVDFDLMIDLIHSVDPAYRTFPSVGFVFNDLTLATLRKLKDLEGRYYWNPGTIAAEPDRIFGFPYQVDQAFPNIAANTTPIAFGVMSKFIIRDHAAYRFYRLEEKYRNTDQTGFVSFSRHDSNLIDAGTGPIKKMTMPAS